MIQLSVNDAPSKLREIRENAKVSQIDLCKALYRSCNYISEIERGYRTIYGCLLTNYFTIFGSEFRIGPRGQKVFEMQDSIFIDIRNYYKKTQLETAFMLGYDQTSIYYIETKSRVKLWQLEDYSKAFGCTIEIGREEK